MKAATVLDKYTCYCGDDTDDHASRPNEVDERPCKRCDCVNFEPRTQLRIPGIDWPAYEHYQRQRADHQSRLL